MKNILKSTVTAIDRKLLYAKMRAGELGEKLVDKKEGSNQWTDILIACLVGLAIGLVVKEAIIPAVQTIIGKITNEINQW